MTDKLRILLVAEHASARFGGEAALPLHHHRVLKRRGHDVWLVSHARTRDELQGLHPRDPGLHFVEDTRLHRLLWRLSQVLPARIDYITTGFLMRLLTQLAARRLVRRLVAAHRINVVHQPMPVSPREPSLMHDVGAPVVIGPMNGGMTYPPAFRRVQGRIERALVGLGRRASYLLNRAMPGKARASALLVANGRTRAALPVRDARAVIELVENGVDLAVWADEPSIAAGAARATDGSMPTWIYMGRLVDWKAVDLLLEAFAEARRHVPMRLLIVGDGPERTRLERLATTLRLGGDVTFTGWLPQADCARLLRDSDGLVLSSLYECGGAVVLEAMAAGRPVVATAWGGPLDYLDETCGVLVPPDSREALVQGFADALAALGADAPRRATMGAAGRRRARALFDWDRKVDRMIEIYRDVIAAPATAGPAARRPGEPPANSTP